MDLYSKEVQQILWNADWPHKLQWTVTNGTDPLGNPILYFVLFRDNFESYDGEIKRHIAGEVGRTLEKIRKLGCPMYLSVEKDKATFDAKRNSLA